MPAQLDRKDVFEPLSLASTTPVVIMIILSIILGFLIPVTILLDKYSEDVDKKEALEVQIKPKEKTLTDVMFFNKYEERTKP